MQSDGMCSMRVIHQGGWWYPIARGDVLYYMDRDRFWMYAHGTVHEVSKREYILGVFGGYADAFEEYTGYYIAFGPDSFFLCLPQQFATLTILEVASDGSRRRCLELEEGVSPAYDIEYQAPNHLWVVTPGIDNVSCVELDTGRFVCDLAGRPIAGVPLACPEAVAVYGEYLYVSECVNRRVCRLRLRGGGCVEGPGECLPIDGAVFAYQRAGGKEYVSTENALYEIENSVWQSTYEGTGD